MIGLGDRVESWVRRVQRPPAEAEPRGPRPDGDEAPSAEPPAGRSGRFARRVLQEEER